MTACCISNRHSGGAERGEISKTLVSYGFPRRISMIKGFRKVFVGSDAFGLVPGRVGLKFFCFRVEPAAGFRGFWPALCVSRLYQFFLCGMSQ